MVSLKYKSFLVGSVTAALFVGCGGSGDLGNQAISAECGILFRCAGTDNDTAYNRIEYGTERGCVQSEQGYDIAEDYRPFIDDGTVVIDNGAADRCLAALGATCTQTVARSQACSAIFVGQVPDGGGCLEDIQCASGACTANGFEQCGSCTPVLPTGAPCNFGDDCADGPSGEYGFCDGAECAIDARSSELTADAAIGMDCGYEQLCEAGLYCQGGTCARWRNVGEACDPDRDSCGRGGFCLQSGEDNDVGTCVRVRIESGPGEDCGILATEVVVCDRAAGLYCNGGDEGVCALYQAEQTEGEYCDETSECVDGLECRGGQCFGEELTDGSVCLGDGQCESNNCVQVFDPTFRRICQPATVCP